MEKKRSFSLLHLLLGISIIFFYYTIWRKKEYESFN